MVKANFEMPVMPTFREQSYLLTGSRRGRVWLMRRSLQTVGSPVSVEANWFKTLAREELYGDVMGFLHTHPPGAGVNPSSRDVRTMRAWCSSFGKPLLCVIACEERVQSTRFEDEQDEYMLPVTELFPRGVVVAVEGV